MKKKRYFKNYKRFLKITVTFLIALSIMAAIPMNAMAATVTTISTSSYADKPNALDTYDMLEFHYLTTVKYVWVKGYMSGQASEGTKLKKGDSMSYTYSGKKAGSVSVGCGVNYAAVGASICVTLPVAKSISKGSVSSVSRVAQSKGTYKLYGKLKYKITTKTTYQRTVTKKYNAKTKKYYYKYGSWKYCLTRDKDFSLASDESYLSKIK